MNPKLKKILIGAALAASGAVAGYFADLASGGELGPWSAIVGAIASTVLNAIKVSQQTTLALFLAFVLPLSACQAACRHITPTPERYPADGAQIVTTLGSELDNFWSKVPRVQVYGVSWDCENNSGQCWSAGDKALATFSRKRHAWVVERTWKPVPVLFDPASGGRLP